jgi:hypothetical protein
MPLPGNQTILPPPSEPTTLTYAQAGNIDAVNSSSGFNIDLTTTQIGAFIATVPCLIRITPGKFDPAGMD